MNTLSSKVKSAQAQLEETRARLQASASPQATTAAIWQKDVAEIGDPKVREAVLNFGKRFKINLVSTDGYNSPDFSGCEIHFEGSTPIDGSYEKGLSLKDLQLITSIFSSLASTILGSTDQGLVLIVVN